MEAPGQLIVSVTQQGFHMKISGKAGHQRLACTKATVLMYLSKLKFDSLAIKDVLT